VTTTRELLAKAHPIIQGAGSSFYFTPETTARGESLGLDVARFYFLGRGGLLGDVDAPVVSSAFGYFAPTLVAHMWESARDKVAPRDAARAHLACAYELGSARLGDISGLEELCRMASGIVEAADADGLALFAGVLAQPVPEDLPARAMHLIIALRELRGSAHLLALRACGLPTKVAHYMKRPANFRLFGWKDEDAPAVGDAERRQMAAAEELTDSLVAPAFEVLDDEEKERFCEHLRAISAALPVTALPSHADAGT